MMPFGTPFVGIRLPPMRAILRWLYMWRWNFFEIFAGLEPLLYLDPGINFDRIAKDFADEAPGLFLHLLGIAPPGVDVDLKPLRGETAPPVILPDYVAQLLIPGQEPCTFHVEFFLRYRREILEIMARYGGSLAWQYKRSVKSVLLLLGSEGAPTAAAMPSFGEVRMGATRTIHEFRTVRLWEQDPGPVLAVGDPNTLPWALLMDLGREDAVRIGRRVLVRQAVGESLLKRMDERMRRSLEKVEGSSEVCRQRCCRQ